MRADQFILLEYDVKKTIQAQGNKLLIALSLHHPFFIPDHLYGASVLAATAFFPAKYAQNRDVVMDIVGKMAAFSSLNAPEVLEKFKEPILIALLKEIEEKDPTAHKEYTPWLARVWAAAGQPNSTEGSLKLEDLNRGNVLGAFHIGKRKRKIKPEHSDIGRYRSYAEFEKTIKSNYNIYNLLGVEDPDEDPGNYEVVYNDGSIVRVIVPLDKQAACYWGKNTEWCTATRTGKNYFDYYNSRGKLYIILPYNPEYSEEKYQLHFETEQFKDENDDDIYLSEILRKYSGLEEFFVRQIPQLKKYMAFIKDDTLTEIIKVILPVALDTAWEIVNEWESNDDYWYSWRTEQAIELGYVTDDGDIDWDRVNEDDRLNDYTEYSDQARRFINDVKSIGNLTGKTIKKLTTEYVESGHAEESMPTISLLPYILIYYVNGFKNSDNGDSLRSVFFKFSFYESDYYNTVSVNRELKKYIQKIGEVDDISIMARTNI